MSVLRLLVKGNRDLSHALLGLRGQPGVQLRHEPGARADVLLQGHGAVPPELLARLPGAGAWISGQLDSRLFAERADAVVLSLEPNVVDTAWRHKQQGYMFSPPHGWEAAWKVEHRQWLVERFAPVPLMSVGEFNNAFRALARGLKERTSSRILVLNCCSVDPADYSFRYGRADPDTRSVRAHRFNLALLGISEQEGISIVDADRILGELGAGRHAAQFLAYSQAASLAIGAEVLRVLEELGLPAAGAGAPAAAAFSGDRPRRLVMPFVAATAQRGTIVKWHKRPGEEIRFGDDLADVRMRMAAFRPLSRGERIRHQLAAAARQGDGAADDDAGGPAVMVRITATDTGYLGRIDAAEGCERSVGELLAEVVSRPEACAPPDGAGGAQASTLAVVANIIA